MKKTCLRCHRSLPIEYFYKHAQMADGHLGKCKQCTRRDVRENRRKRSEFYKAYDRMRANRPDRVAAREAYLQTARGREIAQAAKDKWNRENPEKRRAQIAARNAVRDGRLLRQPCRVCGAKAQAHHHDYSKPLDVVWLCPRHHADEHVRLRDRERAQAS